MPRIVRTSELPINRPLILTLLLVLEACALCFDRAQAWELIHVNHLPEEHFRITFDTSAPNDLDKTKIEINPSINNIHCDENNIIINGVHIPVLVWIKKMDRIFWSTTPGQIEGEIVPLTTLGQIEGEIVPPTTPEQIEGEIVPPTQTSSYSPTNAGAHISSEEEREINRLKKELNTKQKELEKLYDELEDKQSKIKRLLETLARQKVNTDSDKTKMKEMKRESERRQFRLAAQQTALEDSKKQSAQQIRDLRQQIEKNKKKIEQQERSKNNLETSITQLKEARDNDKKKYQEKMEQERQDLIRARRELDELNRHHQDLMRATETTHHQKLSEEKYKLKRKTDAHHQQIASLNKQHKELMREAEHKSEKIHTEEKNKLKNEIETINAKIASLTEQQTKLQRQYEDKMEECKAWADEKTCYDELVNKYKTQNQELTAKVSELKRKNTYLNVEYFRSITAMAKPETQDASVNTLSVEQLIQGLAPTEFNNHLVNLAINSQPVLCTGRSGDCPLSEGPLKPFRTPLNSGVIPKQKSESASGETAPPKQNEAAEDTEPAHVSSDMIQTLVEALRHTAPILFPVTLVSFVAIIGYQQYVNIRYQHMLAALQEQQKGDVETNRTATFREENPLLTDSCAMINNPHSQLVCRYLLAHENTDIDLLLTLLANLDRYFPEQLVYPVFKWHKWTKSGSTQLTSEELAVNETICPATGYRQRLLPSLMEKPANENDFVKEACSAEFYPYLQSTSELDFYRDPIEKAIRTIQLLLKHASDCTEFRHQLIALSSQGHAYFPVLLGLEQMAENEVPVNALDHYQETDLGKRLIGTLVDYAGDDHFFSTSSPYTIFELNRRTPFMLAGVSLSTDHRQHRSPQIISACSALNFPALKALCYSYIDHEDPWQAKLLSMLPEHLISIMPTLKETGESILVPQSQKISASDFMETVLFLLNWLEMEHVDSPLQNKKRFLNAALLYAGVLQASQITTYQSLLSEIWSMQETENMLTNEVWQNYIVNMTKLRKERKRDTLVLTPFWRFKKGNWKIMLSPAIEGETLEKRKPVPERALMTKYDGGAIRKFFSWSPEMHSWTVITEENGEPLELGGRLVTSCNVALAVGYSINQLLHYYAIDRHCNIISTYFETVSPWF